MIYGFAETIPKYTYFCPQTTVGFDHSICNYRVNSFMNHLETVEPKGKQFVSAQDPSSRQLDVLRRAGYTDDELQGISPRQASALISAVAKNGWKRLKRTQLEGVLHELLNDQVGNDDPGVLPAAIPTLNGFEALTHSMSNSAGFAIEEGIAALKYAKNQAEMAALEQGRALGLMRKALNRDQWYATLEALHISPSAADWQMLIAEKRDSKHNNKLGRKAVSARPGPTAPDLEFVRRFVEETDSNEDGCSEQSPDKFMAVTT
jgi:hypothetical protein